MRLSARRAADSVASTVLAALLLVSAAPAYAQDDNTPAPATTTARGGQRTTTSEDTDQPTVTKTDAKTTATDKQTTTAAPTTRGRLTFTSDSSSDDVSSTAITDAPTLTSLSAFHLTGLPTIAGAGIPTQVVPWTGGATFMQKSSLPEGTVFICVGAILGALGGAVLLWRGLVAWSLHRSVKRAAMASHSPDAKSGLMSHGGTAVSGRNGNGYSAAAAASNLSLDGAAALNPDRMSTYHGSKNARLSSVTAGRPSASSLFFSPTAGAGSGLNPAASMYSPNPANRSSGYLPAGYYTSSSSPGPAGGNHVANVGGVGGVSNNSFIPNSIRGGPVAAGYQRASSFGHSPPASPNLPPSRGTDAAYGRTSMAGTVGGTPVSAMSGPGPVIGSRPSQADLYSNTSGSRSDFRLDVPANQQGRAPSAYLEDLFENHGNGPRERF